MNVRKLVFGTNQNTRSRKDQITKQLIPRRFADSVREITCTNKNAFTNYMPKWECDTNDNDVKVVNYEINCEGWDSDDDYMIVKGSCSIKYDVVYQRKPQYKKYFDDSLYIEFLNTYNTIADFFDNGFLKKIAKFQLKPIALKNIDILVFEKNQQTTSRKGQVYEQLQAVKGNKYEPDQVTCTNQGFDGESVIWKCRAPLDQKYKFEKAHVSCEGWSGPGDQNIVPGSCLLEYKISKVQEPDSIYDKQAYTDSYQYYMPNEPVNIFQSSLLSFVSGQQITTRKSMNTNQLLPRRFADSVREITCTNKNAFTNYMPKWECDTNDNDVKVVNYEINCEGWDSDDDYMIVKGSCSIKYDVVYQRKPQYKKYFDDQLYVEFLNTYNTIADFFDNGFLKKIAKFQLKPIALKNIDILVFEKNQQTTSRKGQVYEQLQAAKGNKYEPDQVTCTNQGFDGESVVWKCRTPLDKKYKFEKAHVSCEGWSGPGDQNIVPGSCLLEYKISKVQEPDSIYDKQAYTDSYQYYMPNEPVNIFQSSLLSFVSGQQITTRKSMNTNQLLPRRFADSVREITCTNKNAFTNYMPKWECDTNDNDVKVVNYEINCEGWDSDDDYMIVKGSCSIKYDVVYQRKPQYKKYFDDSLYIEFLNTYNTIADFFDNGFLKKIAKFQLKPIALKNIDILVFEKNQQTTSRKGQVYEQLQAAKGNKYEPDQVTCTNQGFDGESVIWKCRAPLDKKYKFEKAHVSCEGWSGPGDQNIVPGSCLLEYKIGYN
ncbi:SOCE-associated_regulatory factor of calcium homoeostasis [Hexamita inflata]|uniref:Store-operated calcium entry-associated regulatory factor n=1 Tax=Hexamita inflata TaxID=28002 RepID=A0AA86UBA2_9EUKA|nr:SOCE-associated regulatory factor of calcium homoeostasis [Hexamita inflata]CAI9944532.1 SOCE-associated regulatory factor of calcium homoeostasis [Hexamita inflata]